MINTYINFIDVAESQSLTPLNAHINAMLLYNIQYDVNARISGEVWIEH